MAVQSLRIEDGRCVIETDRGRLRPRGLVVATGVRRRNLGLSGEADLLGQGLLRSGSRAPERYAGQLVVVIGGGDAAAENALILRRAGARVILVHRRDRLRARVKYAAAVLADAAIKTLLESEVTALVAGANGKLESIVVRTPDGPRTIETSSVLIRIGFEAQAAILPQSWLSDTGYLRVDRDHRVVDPDGRVVPGIFGAGDIIAPQNPCIATAIGTGASAGRSAAAFVAGLSSAPVTSRGNGGS